MSEITKPIMLDETGRLLVEGIARQNILLSQLISATSEATPVATLNEIHEIVRRGEAPNVFSIGDQINLNYNDGENDYVLPWDIVHFGDVELQDGETVPGMFIQSHYALPGVQLDQNEAFYVVPAGGLSAGTYRFTMGNSWGSKVVSGKTYSFTTTQAYSEGDLFQLGTADSETSNLPETAPSAWRVRTYKKDGSTPASSVASATEILALTESSSGTNLGTLSSSTLYGTSGLNNMQRSADGYNRWGQSALRQYLNSSADVNAWWEPQNPYDRRPDQLATMRGFMVGFDNAFLNIIKPIKVTTALNLVTDTEIGASETTYDTFFPASTEQEYIVPQAEVSEGVYWEYWKQRLGLTSPQERGVAGTNPFHIRYAYNAKTNAVYCRLRSVATDTAHVTWYTLPSGYVGLGFAASASRCAPACVIC